MTGIRVVVTGLAALTPIGNDIDTSWKNLKAGVSGVGPITRFDASAYTSRIAGEVKDFDPEKYIPAKQARRMDRFVQFAVSTSKMLMEHSGLTIDENNADRVGVLLGVGLGGLDTIEKFHARLVDAGPNKVSPFFIPMLISNMAPGQIAIATGATGANLAFTSACASATHAIGYAFSEIKLGRLDAALTGGVESTITPMGVSGFTALKALSASHNDSPTLASRPFANNRDGFVMGEGAGMIMLESLDSALARGAKIYGEIVGFGASDDAYHMTAPHEAGTGMASSMKKAIADAGISPDLVDHINAHGTSTHLNDLCETRAIKTVFGERAYNIAITANKSMTGHLLGAAGGVESAFTVLSLHEGIIPGTINYEEADPECDLDYTTNGSREYQAEYALCNSFGFGGTNATLLFKRYQD